MFKEYAPLSRAEELELTQRFRVTGDQKARARVIMSCAPYAYSLARRYAGTRTRMQEDMRQEALAGLVDAFERFDPTRGPFLAWASMYIRKRLRRFLLTFDTVLSFGTDTNNIDVIKAIRKDPEVSDADVAARFKRMAVSPERVGEIRAAIWLGRARSLDDDSGDFGSLYDCIPAPTPPTDAFIDADAQRYTVNTLLGALKEREHKVVSDFHFPADGAPVTFRELGEREGRTKQCMEQIYKRGLARMRQTAIRTGMWDADAQ